MAFKKAGKLSEDVESEEGEIIVEARNDRLVIMRSDKCLHRMRTWIGKEGMENCSCIIVHFIKK